MGRVPHTHCQDEKGSVQSGPVVQYTSELFLYFTERKNGKRQKEERREIRSHEQCRKSVWAKQWVLISAYTVCAEHPGPGCVGLGGLCHQLSQYY